MMKKIAIGLLVVALIVGAGLYYLLANLDGIVKNAIERYASAALQTTVRLDKVSLDLKDGQGKLEGLHVMNPPGFTGPEAAKLSAIRVKLDTGSLQGSGPVVVREITIDAPEVMFEHTPNGSNFEVLRKSARTYAARGQTGAPPAEGEKGPPPDSGRKLIIDDLYIRNGQVAVSESLAPGELLHATLPVVHVSNIGKAKGGATPAEISDSVMGALTSAATAVAAQEIARYAMGKAAKGALDGIFGR